MYPTIKDFGKQYLDQNVKIGKIKTKKESIQKRNQFIYENKHLPRRQIQKVVKYSFNESLDYEYIGKIISDEKKRRKKL